MPTKNPENQDERDTLYNRGICPDCGERPHSPGRPRCEECHSNLLILRKQGLA